MLPGLKKGWELAPQNFCTPLPYWKKHAKAFFGRNTQKKVNFFMSRRNACYQTEEIAPLAKTELAKLGGGRGGKNLV